MRYLSIIFISILLLTACQSDDVYDIAVSPVAPEASCVPIRFYFSAQPSTRGVDAAHIVLEESQVNHLMYAIFQNGRCRKMEEVDLSRHGIQAGSSSSFYTIQDFPKKWLDATTEIYAVVNAPKALKDSLWQGSYAIPESVLQPLVAEKIDSLAKAKTYDFLVDRVFNNGGGAIPWDGQIYFFPINRNNSTHNEYLPGKYRCRNYADFVSRLHDATLPAEDKAVYQRMWEDLQCRLVLFQGGRYQDNKNQLVRQENEDHAILQSFQSDKDLQRYWLWRSMEWEEDLNQQAAMNHSKWIEQPMMAGFHRLSEDFPTTIVVPIERIYSRIWFDFQWDAQKEAGIITVDSITINGLMNQTKLFNLSKEAIGNNPTESVKTSCTLRNSSSGIHPVESGMRPFFANLYRPPYHMGNVPQMLLYADYPDYRTLAVYEETSDGKVNETKPHRCYVYSFQWGGNSLNDDPEIVVYYHFEKKSAVAGEPGTLIYKKARARLYDEMHNPGKQHHGLLRNYTYQLNARVTSLSHTLEVQVVAVPWYKIVIDDIPPFE